ncbi:MAG: rRNA maturation RNase YbeY [Actinomycetota bacterium]|nr:rRNA maturation RNase YbeY [Actinomycetota bacterium]
MVDPSRPHLDAPRRIGGDGEPEVFVADEQRDLPVELERWQRLATEVLRSEGVRGLAELALLFVSEAEMGELNELHMGKAGPTDVLAFPIDAAEAEIVLHGQPISRGPDRAPADPGDMPLLLGDVVICPAVAARQAPQHAGTTDDELALLVVHGLLHVLGHDHDDDDQTRAMRARELELLQEHHWHGPMPAGFRQEQAE